jgi:hypothetical protein
VFFQTALPVARVRIKPPCFFPFLRRNPPVKPHVSFFGDPPPPFYPPTRKLDFPPVHYKSKFVTLKKHSQPVLKKLVSLDSTTFFQSLDLLIWFR